MKHSPLLGDSRFWNQPRWQGQRGFYEVYFLKFNRVESEQAWWLRYTLTVSRDGAVEGAVWAFWFDGCQPAQNKALRGVFAPSTIRWDLPLQLGKANRLEHHRAKGWLESSQGFLRWELEWEPSPEAVGLFPARWMYERAFPRTKYISPNWNVRLSGVIEHEGERVLLERVPAQQAHLWGTGYAERWVWAHCNAFESSPGVVFEGLEVQIRLGRLRLPPLRMLCLYAEGRWYIPRPSWRRDSQSAIGLWRFRGASRGFTLEGTAQVAVERMLGARYRTPSGEERWCHNSKLASLQLRLMGEGSETLWQTPSACAAEWVEPSPDPRLGVWV